MWSTHRVNDHAKKTPKFEIVETLSCFNVNDLHSKVSISSEI